MFSCPGCLYNSTESGSELSKRPTSARRHLQGALSNPPQWDRWKKVGLSQAHCLYLCPLYAVLPRTVIISSFCSYSVIAIALESFYPQPNSVQWWEAMNKAIRNMREQKLPLTDFQLYEQFKKTFGYAKAIQCKVINKL